MDDHRRILRRVGWSMIAIGLADIAFMIYAVDNDASYSSSLNIFAVVGGVFLCRGNLLAVEATTFFSAFLLAGCSVFLLLFPLFQPMELWWLWFRQDTVSGVAQLGVFIGVTLWLYWVYRQLRMDAVLAAWVAAGRRPRPPWLAFAAGVLLVVGLASMMMYLPYSDDGRKALALAREQAGAGEKLHLAELQADQGKGRATVSVYGSQGVRDITVEW